jgi:hypothetical protein
MFQTPEKTRSIPPHRPTRHCATSGYPFVGSAVFDQSFAIRRMFLDSHSLLLFGINYLLHQRFKTRVATERVEQRINFNVGDF